MHRFLRICIAYMIWYEFAWNARVVYEIIGVRGFSMMFAQLGLPERGSYLLLKNRWLGSGAGRPGFLEEETRDPRGTVCHSAAVFKFRAKTFVFSHACAQKF